MAFEFKNSRGITYYLHQKGGLYYFSKNADNSIDLPNEFIAIENEKTGLPMVKRK